MPRLPFKRIYAGLKPDTDLRRALANRTLADHLASFTPRPGDGVFLQAGTAHALGDTVVVFEVQQKQRPDVSPVRLGPRRRQDRPAASTAHRPGAPLP